MFLDALLQDGAVRTLDGEEADLYYVPLPTCTLTQCERAKLELAVRAPLRPRPQRNRRSIKNGL